MNNKNTAAARETITVIDTVTGEVETSELISVDEFLALTADDGDVCDECGADEDKADGFVHTTTDETICYDCCVVADEDAE